MRRYLLHKIFLFHPYKNTIRTSPAGCAKATFKGVNCDIQKTITNCPSVKKFIHKFLTSLLFQEGPIKTEGRKSGWSRTQKNQKFRTKAQQDSKTTCGMSEIT